MRIAIEVGSLLKERSGVGQYVYHLVNGLGTVDSTNEYRLFYSSLRQPIHCLPSFPYSSISSKRVRLPAKALLLATGLGRWKLPGFHRFFGSANLFHWPNYLLVPGGSGKHVITICDLTFLLFPAYHPARRVRAFTAGISRSVSRADAIIVISQHTKHDVMKYLGIPEDKIHVVYCAASPRFHPIPPHQSDPILSKYLLRREHYVLFAGNIEPRKNIMRLLEAYARLKARWTYAYPLILAGGQGWRNADIYRGVKELSLEKDVRFLGYVPDEELPALMSGAALFVYPSLYEGFGMPPLEAMACGTPVVTSNSSSLPEVVGDAALLIDPHDVEELAEGMHQALTDRELRDEMRQRGLARAKLFSWEETARQTLKVYGHVHGGSQSS